MKETPYFDVIIIGTGAGGGTLAHRLAPSGKKILLIERGSYLPREKENWESKEIFLTSRYAVKEKWIDKKGKEFTPGTHYYVGGNTKFYGAALLRMREKDFGELSTMAGSPPHGRSTTRILSPTTRWQKSSTTSTDSGGSIRRSPPRKTLSPTRPSPMSRVFSAFTAPSKEKGYHPFPLPLGLILDEKHRQKSPCIKCNTCDGFPCLVNAKADSHIVCVEPPSNIPTSR